MVYRLLSGAQTNWSSKQIYLFNTKLQFTFNLMSLKICAKDKNFRQEMLCEVCVFILLLTSSFRDVLVDFYFSPRQDSRRLE